MNDDDRLYENESEASVEWRKALILRKETGSLAEVERLLVNGSEIPDPYDEGDSAFTYAILENDADLLTLLLKHRPTEINKWSGDLSWTPLHNAINEDRLALGIMILDAGADPDRHNFDLIGDTPLFFAVQRGYNARHIHEWVKLLLARGADPRIRCGMQQSPLDIAIRRHRQSAMMLRRTHRAWAEIVRLLQNATDRLNREAAPTAAPDPKPPTAT